MSLQKTDGTKPLVLVVDDEPEILALCERLLRLDYEVVTSTSAQEGLDRVRARRFSAAIVDQVLPNADGIELMSRLQALDPNVGRILMTGHATQERVIAAINEGKVHAYLLKPWAVDEFKEVVAHVVEGARRRQSTDDEHQRYRALVYDSEADLPTRDLVEAEVAEWLRREGCLGVLVIDASEVWATQSDLGRVAFEGIRDRFIGLLRETHARQLRNEDILAVDEVESPLFCIFLARPRGERLACTRDIEAVARRVQDDLGGRFTDLLAPQDESWPRIAVGHGFTVYNPTVSPRYQLRSAIREGRQHASQLLASDVDISGRSQLERIIVEGDIRTVFQPIVSIRECACLGFEALSRGPRGSHFEQPSFLLKVADRTGLGAELDRAFRTKALATAARLPSACRLFVNTLPQGLAAPDMRADRLLAAVTALGIDPRRLVLEISERYVVRNEEAFGDLITRYRDAGIDIAIDDVGVGYSGLERISQLAPRYLKVDICLVAGIHENPVKRSLLAALVSLARDMKAEIIAEGVERPAELACLRDLGVDLVQGYLLGRPAEPDVAAAYSVGAAIDMALGAPTPA